MNEDEEIFTRTKDLSNPRERLGRLIKLKGQIARRAHDAYLPTPSREEEGVLYSGTPGQLFFSDYGNQEIYKAIKKEIGITEREATLLPEPTPAALPALPDTTGSNQPEAGEGATIHPREIVLLAKKGRECTHTEMKRLADYIRGAGVRGLNDEVGICMEMNRKLTSTVIGQILKTDEGNVRRTTAWKTRK